MNNRLDRKLDLLQDCNDQGVPPREFMALFCKRCRNGGCVNSGWSESAWSDRIATQVNRLLTNPNFADPNDPNFKEVRSLEFRQVEEPLIIRGGDPWSGPTVHLATPARQVNTISEVENAISALSEARGKPPPRVVEVSEPEPPRVVREAPPTQPTQPVTRPRENPRHYVVDTPNPKLGREVNTAFPGEGIMLDGSPPPPVGVDPSGVDPWAPSLITGPKKVAVGARIRMGEGPKK